MANSLLQEPGHQPPSLPSRWLRLQLLHLGVFFQDERSLRGTIERCIGVRLPDGRSPDELAAILIELEDERAETMMHSLIKQYSEPGTSTIGEAVQ